MAFDMTARKGDLLGREAYEEDVRLNPTYDKGVPRPSWDELDEVVQWSWNRPWRGDR
jgi:hypothetical protein